MGKGERLAYFDFLRGVAILMVVAIHTYSGGGFETPMGWLRMCVRQAVACAVPVFLAVSGFFLARKALKTWSERWVFWRKQIPKVYIPCVVWSVLAVGHGWVFAESLTTWGGGEKSPLSRVVRLQCIILLHRPNYPMLRAASVVNQC